MIVDTNYFLMGKNQRYQELASKWLNNTISEEEKKEFAAWYNDGQDRDILIESAFATDEEEYRKQLLARIHQLIQLSEKKGRKTIGGKKLWISLAAAVICLVVLGVFLRPDKVGLHNVEMAHMDDTKIAPDVQMSNQGVTLILDNGRIVMLDKLAIGKTVNEHGVTIKKIASNAVHYLEHGGQQIGHQPVVYHTMKTPPGKDYHLILSDGSKVWLNAASEFRFSAQTDDQERRVKLNGEAYFAVSHSPQSKIIPFIVESRLQEVHVLGTEFNINAYPDEEWIRTTLVKGAVKVKQSENNAMALLKPAHQSSVGSSQAKIKIKKVDVAQVVSWKNGYFNFNESDITDVLRQFARWYDVEVIYAGDHVTDAYVGKIPKSLTLEQALAVLETVGVKYKMEDKKLIIQ